MITVISHHFICTKLNIICDWVNCELSGMWLTLYICDTQERVPVMTRSECAGELGSFGSFGSLEVTGKVLDHSGSTHGSMRYPLVMTNIAVENHHF